MKIIKKKLTSMQIIALGYLIIILVGTLLLSLPAANRQGVWTSFTDALFTSTSATCVTGLVTLPTYDYWNLFGQIVILVLIQIGGVGFMTVVTMFSVFVGRRISLHERRLFMMTAGSGSIGGAIHLFRNILIGTLIFEGAGAIVLAVRFWGDMEPARAVWYAVFHSVSAFCNAGFDLMGRFGQSSLTGYTGDVTVNLTVMTLVIVGGLGFVVWRDIAACRFNIRKWQLHTRIVVCMTLILLVAGAVLFFAFEYGNDSIRLTPGERVLSAMFNSVTPRTAGFNTVDLASLTDGSIFLTIIFMIIGGAPGSTAGGIKVTTFLVLLLGTLASARKSPNINIFKRRLEQDTLRQASAIATIYLCVMALAVTCICAIQPELTLKQVMFETVSALSNVGMTLGITSALNIVSKVIITLLMYCGRVGILSLALVLAEKRDNVPVTRPAEDIIVG